MRAFAIITLFFSLAVTSAVPEKVENAELYPLDVVMVAVGPDCVTPLVVRGLNEHLHVSTIYVITQTEDKCEQFDLHGPNVRCHTENDLVPELTLQSVRDHFSNSLDDTGSVNTAHERAGWYFQQLLKLGAASALPELSQHFMVWDSDMIPLRPFPLAFPSSVNDIPATRADISSTRMSVYSHTYRHIFGRDVEYPRAGHSFVAHWMLVYQPYLSEMLADIENRTGKHWPWALLDGVQTGYENVYLGLSEYTTYISWVLQNKPGAIEVMPEKEFYRAGPRKGGWPAKQGFMDCCPDAELLDAARAEGWAYFGWELGHFHQSGCSEEDTFFHVEE